MSTSTFCKMLERSLEDEQEARAMYESMVEAAPSEEERQAIRDIAAEEQKHRETFQQMASRYCVVQSNGECLHLNGVEHEVDGDGQLGEEQSGN